MWEEFDFFNINQQFFGKYDVFLEVKLGDAIIEKQQLSLPKEVLLEIFKRKIREVSTGDLPYRVRIWFIQQIYDDNNKHIRTLTTEIKFGTNSYVRNFPDEWVGDTNV